MTETIAGAPHSRQRALTLLHDWTKGESLRKHAIAVAICTESYGRLEAERLGFCAAEADAFAEPYAVAGLLHDMDYERHPTREEHPFVGVAALPDQGWPEPVLHAILAHADYSGVTPQSHLDKALFACDELSGFLTACALVKPTRSILDLETRSVLKKMKDKAFARAVNRADIAAGAQMLGLPLEQHIQNCLSALQARAGEAGLAGLGPIDESCPPR